MEYYAFRLLFSSLTAYNKYINDSTAGAAKRAEVRALIGMLDPSDTSTQSISRIQTIRQLQATLTAVEAEEIAELETLRHDEEAARGVAKARRGNGLAAEIGLARNQSPARGARSLQTATVLSEDMPQTLAALSVGQLDEERAQAVVKEVSWLSPEHRAEVDELIAGQLEGLGPRKLAGKVRAHAEQLDQHGAVARHEIAASQRRVTVRPAAHGMAYVTALVTTQQAVGILATLTRDANSVVSSGETADPNDPTGQPRTHGQIMADLFIQRVNGHAPQAVPAQVHVVMTDDALFGEGETPAWITGHGPIPAALARRWLRNPDATVFLRRLFTRPRDGQLVAMESQAQDFPVNLRQMITLRDDTCRTPYCDARIKDTDHATPHREGGPTNWNNGSGLCAGCNQNKENTGWRHQATPEHLTVTTPTGHQYTKPTGPVLEGMPPDKKEPPEEEPGPEVRPSTDCYTTNTTWTTSLRIAA